MKSKGKVMVIEYWNEVRLDWDLNMNEDEYWKVKVRWGYWIVKWSKIGLRVDLNEDMCYEKKDMICWKRM